MELPERKIYSVSEFTEKLKTLLEREFPSLWIQGEVSNFRQAASGHLYFTLKDDAAQIRCVMFKLQSRFMKFRPEDGLQVIAWGRVAVYGPRGEYQLIIDTMEPVGFGSLMLAFEQLKRKLEAEGLFDPGRKKPLPRFPSRVGLVTSSSGAAVLDMIRIIRRRLPRTHVLVSPATVQGDKAPAEIVAALKRLCDAGDVDVIIVGRGGGSIEDLWAFNDERVVRAVAYCPFPTVAAVGHETDFTLTDFAADMRASTPSAAAELVVPDRRDLRDVVVHLGARLRNGMLTALDRRDVALRDLLKRVRDPRRDIGERRMRVDELSLRLTGTMNRKLAELRQQVDAVTERLRPEHLEMGLLMQRELCQGLFDRLVRATRDPLTNGRRSVETLAARLDALSPLAVLARGYSITFDRQTRAVVTDASTVAQGQDVDVRLRRGELLCRIIETRPPADEV